MTRVRMNGNIVLTNKKVSQARAQIHNRGNTMATLYSEKCITVIMGTFMTRSFRDDTTSYKEGSTANILCSENLDDTVA